MLRTTERTVHFYDLISTAHSKKIENPACAPMLDLMAIVAESPGLRGREIYRSNNVAIEVADFSFDPESGTLALLINRADRNVSDVTFKDFGTRQRRKAGKKNADGIEASSHVLIKLDEVENKATFTMTMGASVTSAHVERLFKEVVESSSSISKYKNTFEFNDPNGAEKYKVKYSFEALGLKGSHLEDAFQNGAFQGFTLVAGVHEMFDSAGNYQVREQELEVVAPTPALATRANFLNSVRNFLSRTSVPYDRVRIRYKKPGSDDPSNATIPLNDLDAAFGKREKIYFETELEDQQSRLNDEIIGKMKDLMAGV